MWHVEARLIVLPIILSISFTPVDLFLCLKIYLLCIVCEYEKDTYYIHTLHMHVFFFWYQIGSMVQPFHARGAEERTNPMTDKGNRPD